MQNITENLTKLISEITQMEMDNKKLNEDIREIEKEKAEAYKKFDTDTHVLVEREMLQAIIDNADELSSNANYTEDYIESAESSISDARYNSGDMVNQASGISGDLEKLLKSTKGEENE